MVQTVPIGQQTWGHSSKRGGTTQEEGTQLKIRVGREAAVEACFKPLPVCVFILTLQVGRRCEEGTAVFFSVVPLAREL